MNIAPVWLDGPLHGQPHEVTPEEVEQGSYVHEVPDGIYTFTRVQMFGRTVVVASTRGSIPPEDQLFTALASQAAQAAAE
jgi:hypothetical protein